MSQYPDSECSIAGDCDVASDSSDSVANGVHNFCRDISMKRCDSLFGKPKCDPSSNIALKHHCTIDYMSTTLATTGNSFDTLEPDMNSFDHLPLICTVEISSDRHVRTFGLTNWSAEPEPQETYSAAMGPRRLCLILSLHG